MARPTKIEGFEPVPLRGGTGACEKKKVCKHHFVFLRSAKYTDNSSSYNTQFIRIDTFFCEKCLEQKEVRKDGYGRDTPDWYRGE